MRFLIFMSFIIGIGVCHAQTPDYRIVSQIEGMESDRFSLTIWDGFSRAVTKKDLPMVNGQIDYVDTTSIPLMIRIHLPEEKLYKRSGRGYFPTKSQHIWLVALPGASVTLKGKLTDFSEVYPEGDRENEILASLTERYYPLLNQAVNISVILDRNKETLDAGEVDKYKLRQRELNGQADRVLLDFLEEHPSSIAGLFFMNDALTGKKLTVDRLLEILPRIGMGYQTTAFYTRLLTRIEGAAYDVGKPMFTIQSDRTPDGIVFSTAEWAGRFYLIDFWGSWCMPCIKDFPHLKRFREELDGKVEILGIASDTKEKWLQAIRQHELDWQHILIGEGDQNYSLRLNVTGYPTKILVDPKGKIVYRSSGGGEASFRKMAEIVRNWSGE